MHVFEDVEPDHQTRRQGRVADVLKHQRKGFIEALPVDRSGQPDQLVARIEMLSNREGNRFCEPPSTWALGFIATSFKHKSVPETESRFARFRTC